MDEATPSYDEEVTPDIDPPQIEPPPPVTLLGRIFAHRRKQRTVLRAPLVRVGRAPEPAPAEPEPAAPPPPPEPEPPRGTPDVPEPPRVAPAPAPAAPGGPAAANTPASVSGPAAQPAADPGRYCPECDERVAVAEDGVHCERGHRLSPAHARRRGWLRRRRRSH